MTRSLGLRWLAAACMGVAACGGPSIRPDPVTPARPDAVALFGQALAAHQGDDVQRTLSLWQQVIAAAPTAAAPHINLGIAYRKAGRMGEAIREYEAAIRLDPRNAAAYHNLGLAHRLRGAWAEAEQAYRRALELRPEQVETHYNLGVLYELFLNRPEDALTHYRAVFATGGADAEAVAPWIRALERRLAQHRPPKADGEP